MIDDRLPLYQWLVAVLRDPEIDVARNAIQPVASILARDGRGARHAAGEWHSRAHPHGRRIIGFGDETCYPVGPRRHDPNDFHASGYWTDVGKYGGVAQRVSREKAAARNRSHVPIGNSSQWVSAVTSRTVPFDMCATTVHWAEPPGATVPGPRNLEPRHGGIRAESVEQTRPHSCRTLRGRR